MNDAKHTVWQCLLSTNTRMLLYAWRQQGMMMLMLTVMLMCLLSSWDNGDTEKMSPWDMETIPADGESPRSVKHNTQ